MSLIRNVSARGKLISGILRFRSHQLRCRDISAAFPEDDYFSAAETGYHKRNRVRLTDDFSAFVFKIQANMNKAHRDRIAFMRICIRQVRGRYGGKPRSGRQEDPSVPAAAADGCRSRKIVDEAYAGDIIGVFDPGIFCHRRYAVHCPTRSSSLRVSRPSLRSISPACARSIP